MQLGTGAEAGAAAFRLALFVRAQQIAGIIPEKVREDADGTGYGGGQLHGCWAKLGFLSNLLLPEHRHHIGEFPCFIQTQGIADFCRAPAGARQLALLRKILKEPGQCLQNHVRTS